MTATDRNPTTDAERSPMYFLEGVANSIDEAVSDGSGRFHEDCGDMVRAYRRKVVELIASDHEYDRCRKAGYFDTPENDAFRQATEAVKRRAAAIAAMSLNQEPRT